jgi:hypothetical protein
VWVLNRFRQHGASTVERQDFTMRMPMRGLARLSNGFSGTIGNHAAALALHSIRRNFVCNHKMLRIAPAIAAGVSDQVWSYEEVAAPAN